MAAGGVLGNNTRVGFSTSSPVSYTRIPQVLDVKYPGVTPDKLDKTPHSSGGFYQNMQGLKQVSDTEILLLDDPDDAVAGYGAIIEQLRVHQAAGTTIYWKIERPTNRAMTRYRAVEFQGYISDFMPATPVKDKQTLMLKVVFDDSTFTTYPAGAATIA